ncbi:hypothetical protein QTO34_015567 [Cnephaeus nilssonii]|uniref:G-protein coupled receptors family 1 profile domain-containing protein n=1 Tax=Cnephaeus nilssonii TaxID=3371016 RepID=A0AA40I5D0_CNENI|nr:hypothetical protein QTO34_015567 [Eptesicus nilssonii]
MAVLQHRRGLWGNESTSRRGPSKAGELGACLLRHQAFQKPPPRKRLLKGLVHQRTGTQLPRDRKCPGYIEPQNLTRVSEFFLLGLSDDLELQPLLLGLFLSMYLVAVLGNMLIILTVSSDSHLHTPMYFFLCNLSLADIVFPKMIVGIQTHSRVISYGGCLTQMSFLILFGCMDGMLLTVMAYDRFVAICHPLHYSAIMSPCLCCFLVLMSFFISLLDSQLHTLIVLQLTCFKDVNISNFFCDPSQLLHLACSDTITNDIVMYFVGAISGFLPISGIFFSYYKIVSSILRVPSTGGKYKAFSTCGSHLSVVCLFYGTAIGGYLGSALLPSPRKDEVASVMYTVVTPMLNPFIYSLRNRDIKSALWKLYSRTLSGYFLKGVCADVEPQNLTGALEFLLLGFSDDPELQPLTFSLFLAMYLVTLLGNLLIILAIGSDSRLHTPMYFFLCNLSMADIGFSSTTVPKVLLDIQTHSRVISYAGCLTQLSYLIFFACLDSALLTVMAYDRFVAVCYPLHYLDIMNPRVCSLLLLLSFLISLLDSQLHCLMISQLSFCTNMEIPHFFCDPPQLLELACDDTSANKILLYFWGAIFGGIPVSGIFFSYYKIVSSILRISSSGVMYKAFSTCGSHLSVVCLFYGTGLGLYLSSAVSHFPRKAAGASVVYTVVTPMLNPFIYSLRNRDIKRALQRFLNRVA